MIFIVVALVAVYLLAMTFRSGNWVRFRMLDYVEISIDGKAAARQAVAGLVLRSHALQTGSQGLRVLYEQEELNCYPERLLD